MLGPASWSQGLPHFRSCEQGSRSASPITPLWPCTTPFTSKASASSCWKQKPSQVILSGPSRSATLWRFIDQRDSFCVSWKTSSSGLPTLKGSHSFVCWPGGTQTFYDVLGGGGRECLAGVPSASGCVIGTSSASSVEVIPPLLCGQICYLRGSAHKTIAPFDREMAWQPW